MRTLLIASWLPLLTGCLSVGGTFDVCCKNRPPAPDPTGVVFVANGSGDFRTVTASLGQVVAETAAPLRIETVLWSHGFGRYVTDHVDHFNHLTQGSRLAGQVTAYRQAHPGQKVFLIGHSAGCAVALAAAERLPADSVDRVVLLAPSVCVSYDLRPALRAARCGIDVFYSREDYVILGLGMQLVGTADRCCHKAAGQYGFTPIVAGPQDAALYGKLRQHSWDPAVGWSGHDGGHYGSNGAGFLRAYVLPLLLVDDK
jgi:pimeloyl-ACP methyl ester carboxylesterase